LLWLRARAKPSEFIERDDSVSLRENPEACGFTDCRQLTGSRRKSERRMLMRTYEVLFIVAPNTEEGDVESLITQLSEAATTQGAQIAKVDRIGRRRLAYPIQRFTDGYYVVLTVEGTGAEIAEIERRMRVTDAIIRYLTIRIDEDLKRAEKFKAKRTAKAAAKAAAPGRRRRAEKPVAVADGDEVEGEVEE
jgi:small subunit ribosomal protein S6